MFIATVVSRDHNYSIVQAAEIQNSQYGLISAVNVIHIL